MDKDKRAQDVRDVITALRDNVTMIPMFEPDLPFVVGPKVGDWTPTPGDKDLNSLETVTPAQ